MKTREYLRAIQKKWRENPVNAEKIKRYRARPDVRERNKIRRRKAYLKAKAEGRVWGQLNKDRVRAAHKKLKYRSKMLLRRGRPTIKGLCFPDRLIELTEKLLQINETYETKIK